MLQAMMGVGDGREDARATGAMSVGDRRQDVLYRGLATGVEGILFYRAFTIPSPVSYHS